MAASSDGSSMGQRRFSGESLDPKEYRRWRLWALAKMASTKDMTPTHRGPYVFCLLDGLALETVEHLTLDLLREENGDKHIGSALMTDFQTSWPTTTWPNVSRKSLSCMPRRVRPWWHGARESRKPSLNVGGKCRWISPLKHRVGYVSTPQGCQLTNEQS